MHPRLRASELVSAPMHLPYLLEQRLKHLVIDRQVRSTLLAAERTLDEPLAHAPLVFAKIALAHLHEVPDYYTLLEQLEKQAKRDPGAS
jgi:uncharacterized protein DUF5661